MKSGTVTRRSWLTATMVCLALLALVAVGTGCKPAGYLSKNMCNIFDCDTLFFIEDIFPLSARPTTTTTTGMDMSSSSSGGHEH